MHQKEQQRTRLLALGIAISIPVLIPACSTPQEPTPDSVVAEPIAVEIEPMPPPAPELRRFTISDRVPAGLLPAVLEIPESPPPPSDLLERLRTGMSLEISDQKAVAREINWYIRHPRYVERAFLRGEPYLHYIVERLEERGLPLELALLPIVESAFDPFAYSHGRAAGLWQFIPSTGRRYGLRQDWWYDGRRDVIESTRAALDYLEFLAEEFNGDWLLAVAAYNTGEKNLRRAIDRNRKRKRPADFWHLTLPDETRAYVPKLLAMVDLVSRPEHYGLALPSFPNAPYFTVVDTGGQIDLAVAAELAQTSIDDMYLLNAGFNRWATDPAGPHRLLVPVASSAEFATRLASLPESQRMRWGYYEIRSGDTLTRIARRFDTSVAHLQEVNELEGTLIRAGAELLVPTSTQSLGSYAFAESVRLDRVLTRNPGGRRIDYVVKPGDSLWRIASTHGIGTSQLASWNGMTTNDPLSIGRKLVIWDTNGSTRRPINFEGVIRKINYVIRNGDSLWNISSRFKVSVDQLLRWNDIAADVVLRPGDRLVMFVDVTRQWEG